MFSAGYLEGYLTQQYIFDSYQNFVNSVLLGNHNISEGATEFILNQLDWIDEQIVSNSQSEYWQLVKGLIAQLKGMYMGYQSSVYNSKRHNESLDFFHFYYLTNMGDLEDIIPAFGLSKMLLKKYT